MAGGAAVRQAWRVWMLVTCFILLIGSSAAAQEVSGDLGVPSDDATGEGVADQPPLLTIARGSGYALASDAPLSTSAPLTAGNPRPAHVRGWTDFRIGSLVF